MMLRSIYSICILVLLLQAPAWAQKSQPQRPTAPKVSEAELHESAEATRNRANLEAEAAKKTFAQLSEDVRDPDQQKRLATIRALSRHFVPETRQDNEKLLLDLIQDASWIVRGESAYSLGFGTASPPVLSALLQALKDDHWFVRARAVQSLGRLKAQPGVAELVRLFPTESWDNQARIAYALGEIGDPQAVETLLAALSGEDESLHWVAYSALKNFHDERVARKLAEHLALEKTPTGKLLLTRAVGTLKIAEGKAPITSWRGESPEMDREITLALYRLGEEAETENLLRDFAVYPKPTQLEILASWQQKGEVRAVPVLLTVLAEGPPAQRQAAALALESIRKNLPLAAVLGAMTDADPATRETLVRVLKNSRDPHLPDLIISRLKVAPPPTERDALISVLQAFNTSSTITALLGARIDEKQKLRPGIVIALEKFNITLETLSARAANKDLPIEQRIEATLWLGLLGDPTAIGKLAQLRETTDPKQRLAAVQALGRLEDRTATEPLILSLDDPDANVRTAAGAALGHLGLTPERLTNDLKSKDWQIRIEALRLLSRLGNTGHTQAILALLQDPESLVRRAAANVLGIFKDVRAVDGLLTALRDSDLSVRAAAAAALGEIGDARASSGLLAALRNNFDAGVNAEIAGALARLKSTQAVPVLIENLRSPNWTARAQVARVLGDFRDPRAIPPLTSALEDVSAVVRYYARQALVQIGVPSPESLVRLFARPEARARFGAMEVIRQTNLTASVDLLVERLHDERPSIRAMAAYTLGNLHDPRALEPLLDQLETEDRFTVRWWLSYALGQMGDPAREPLIRRTRHKKIHVRADALRALGFMPPTDDTRKALLAALDDKDEQARSSAIEALGRSQDPAGVSQLVALLEAGGATAKGNPHEGARPDAVVAALFNLGEAGKKALAAAATHMDAGQRSVILHKLGEDADPAVLPVLTAALRDASPRVRITAMQELARQSDEKALELIVGLLNDSNAEVRLETVRVLGTLGDTQAVEGLKAHLKKEPAPEIRTAIEAALKRLSTPQTRS